MKLEELTAMVPFGLILGAPRAKLGVGMAGIAAALPRRTSRLFVTSADGKVFGAWVWVPYHPACRNYFVGAIDVLDLTRWPAALRASYSRASRAWDKFRKYAAPLQGSGNEWARPVPEGVLYLAPVVVG